MLKRGLVILWMLGAAMAAELTTKKALNLAVAKEMAAAAEKEARANKWNMVIAIVDDGGNLIYLERMDGVQIGSVDVAIAKAQSAVKFKRATKVFEEALKGGRQAILRLPGAIPIEGGVPVMVDGLALGAIGVSGAQSNEDGVVAAAGLKVLGM